MSNIFKPRDFIYINENKLDSYFSQLYGGLITHIQNQSENTEGSDSITNVLVEGQAEIGIGHNPNQLFNLMNKIMGVDAKVGGSVSGNKEDQKSKVFTNSTSNEQVLSHFKYSMFEKSITEFGYLIDLDQYVLMNKKTDAGQIRGNLSSSDFIKFTASNIEIRDYRNASEFVSLLKKIFEMAVNVNAGSVIDSGEFSISDNDQLRNLSETILISKILNKGQISFQTVKLFQVIVNVIDEVFKGSIIPLDIMMISEKMVGKNSGSLKFESLLKEKYFLEDRLDLSFKYGTYEDANWTIIGQLTTVKYPERTDITRIMEEYTDKFSNLSNDFKLDINEFLKNAIKEIDVFSKKVGLMPQLSDKHLAITPIAIFREPQINSYFKTNK